MGDEPHLHSFAVRKMTEVIRPDDFFLRMEANPDVPQHDFRVQSWHRLVVYVENVLGSYDFDRDLGWLLGSVGWRVSPNTWDGQSVPASPIPN